MISDPEAYVIGVWSLSLVLVALALAWYLSHSAARLDRLHQKVEVARTALDVQLVRRSAAAIEAAAFLDPASALVVSDAATRAMAAAERADTAQARATRDPLEVPAELESLENTLTRALEVAFVAGPPDPQDPFATDSCRILGEACRRVQLARRLHNDAVAQALRVRRKPVVRWARLAGHAPMPQMIEFDDTTPPRLIDLD